MLLKNNKRMLRYAEKEAGMAEYSNIVLEKMKEVSEICATRLFLPLLLNINVEY